VPATIWKTGSGAPNLHYPRRVHTLERIAHERQKQLQLCTYLALQLTII
jgi:hypothetical protein